MKTITRNRKIKNITKKNRRRNHSVKNRVKYGSGKPSTHKKINCSPKPNDKLNNYTCYTNDALIYLRDHWNARHPDVKIESNSPKEIHDNLVNILEMHVITKLVGLNRKELLDILKTI